MSTAVAIHSMRHVYPASRRQKEPRTALNSVTLEIQEGEMFCLLGPNGSGKSTLFKILSTLLQPTSGTAEIFAIDLLQRPQIVRQMLGVVFQNPSLDAKLTTRENLLHQGHLYGLRGTDLVSRMNDVMRKVGVLDRANDLVEHLSGGYQRRVELAKCLLHDPKLLLLDEPSTGLDPGARHDFDDYLRQLGTSDGVTVLLTSHILDEAEKCDRIAVMDKGSIVAQGTPQSLKREIGGDVITIHTGQPEVLCASIQSKFGGSPRIIDATIRIERSNGHEFIPQLVQAFPGIIDAVMVSKPTLEDVFIERTGHTFWQANGVVRS
jgi:ABC-2 type transport system ATP-binding protein